MTARPTAERPADHGIPPPALSRLAASHEDVKGYVSIPYWSQQNQRTYDLFDEREILSRTSKDGLVVTEVAQHMERFDDFKARYSLRPIGEAGMPARALWYTSENLSPIVYRRVRAVASRTTRTSRPGTTSLWAVGLST